MALSNPPVQPWCVRMTGPDDLLHLDSSRAEAVAIAHELNAGMLQLMAEPPSPHFPMAWAVPEPMEDWSDRVATRVTNDAEMLEANKQVIDEELHRPFRSRRAFRASLRPTNLSNAAFDALIAGAARGPRCAECNAPSGSHYVVLGVPCSQDPHQKNWDPARYCSACGRSHGHFAHCSVVKP